MVGEPEKLTGFVCEPRKQMYHNSRGIIVKIPKRSLESGCRCQRGVEPLYMLVFALCFFCLLFTFLSIALYV